MSLINKGTKSTSYFGRYANNNILFDTTDKRYFLSTYIKSDYSDYVIHIADGSDSLDSLALQYYGNSLLWWVIADANDIVDCFAPIIDKTLRIPNITNVAVN